MLISFEIRPVLEHPVSARHQTQAVRGRVELTGQDGGAFEGWDHAGDGGYGRDGEREHLACGPWLLCQGRRQGSWGRPHRVCGERWVNW